MYGICFVIAHSVMTSVHQQQFFKVFLSLYNNFLYMIMLDFNALLPEGSKVTGSFIVGIVDIKFRMSVIFTKEKRG